MAYCPKCKSEYENGVMSCAECGIDLVADLAQFVEFVALTEIEAAQGEQLEKYLKYCGIKNIITEMLEENLLISVDKKVLEMAKKHMQVYIYNTSIEEKQEGYIESEPEEKETDINYEKVSDFRSSAISFVVMGAIVFGFGIANLTGIIDIVTPIVKIILTVFGLALIGLGATTYKKLPGMEKHIMEREEERERIVIWYQANYPLDKFIEYKGINLEDKEEGALYFEIIEILKEDIVCEFPSSEKSVISEAAEEIFGKIPF